MSNFHFLKKDLEWKIVNLQGWELLSHSPTTHKWHPIIFCYRSRKNTIHSCTLTSCAKRTHTHHPVWSPFHVSLLYSFKRENTPFLGTPEMSDKLRYEWQYVNTLQPVHSHTSPFWSSIFSLFSYHSREKTYILHYTPFRGSPEMSDKLRYESQIILRYYVLIIHEVSFSRHTTSPCKTISLERKTAPHFLSHWTTHLQYRRKYYAYSCTQ
jgi:hypothetical protein